MLQILQHAPFMQNCLHAVDVGGRILPMRGRLISAPTDSIVIKLYLPHTLFFVKIPAA